MLGRPAGCVTPRQRRNPPAGAASAVLGRRRAWGHQARAAGRWMAPGGDGDGGDEARSAQKPVPVLGFSMGRVLYPRVQGRAVEDRHHPDADIFFRPAYSW